MQNFVNDLFVILNTICVGIKNSDEALHRARAPQPSTGDNYETLPARSFSCKKYLIMTLLIYQINAI